eukprot:12899143-Prorocentrum_lima.AAC.1
MSYDIQDQPQLLRQATLAAFATMPSGRRHQLWHAARRVPLRSANRQSNSKRQHWKNISLGKRMTYL